MKNKVKWYITILFLFSYFWSVYGERTNTYCGPESKHVSATFDLASKACSEDLQCQMFYDSRGKGELFVLCNSPAAIRTSYTGSILYVKKGK